MGSIENLKTYRVVYRTISPTGIIGISFEKQKIEAKNKENAIEILRSTLVAGDGMTIRIDKVEHLDAIEIVKPKRKRSILGWLAVAVMGSAFLARLVDKLF